MRLEQVEVYYNEVDKMIAIQQDDHGMGEHIIYFPIIEATIIANEIVRLAQEVVRKEADNGK